ncbi:U7 snRNA-associated Sm-like protein LSm11 isoform X1 [Rhinatrema bivittatum]|uniref:U7 snRNA-associated Sm-like protein LSm11 isoform X1 n=1 Tax=Rhinatrema bivittatum TaxID=194408 RepID=UPI00112D5E1B|nr:U7 snRNA-associated Sm-like protein LSm11 isoform X1 [Rhinatrema bivittatum]
MEEEERQGAGVVAAAASSLDVSSELFDPLLALYSPCTPIPFPNVRCFNNLAEYESFLQRGGLRARGAPSSRKASKLRKHRGPPPPDPARIERLKQLMVTREGEGEGAPREPRRKRIPKNVLTRMPLNKGSPLGELYRCVRDRIKINVHIRTFKGLRGVCAGFLVAFDKFWNMALTDVDETYRKPVLGKAFFHEPQLTLTRLFDRLKIQESRLQAGDESQASLRRPVAAEEVKPSAESQQGRATGEGKGPAGDHEEAPQGTSAATACKPSEGSSIPGGKVKEPRVDYQQVFTRHMKQVFIRGENVLLVHLAP